MEHSRDDIFLLVAVSGRGWREESRVDFGEIDDGWLQAMYGGRLLGVSRTETSLLLVSTAPRGTSCQISSRQYRPGAANRPYLPFTPGKGEPPPPKRDHGLS